MIKNLVELERKTGGESLRPYINVLSIHFDLESHQKRKWQYAISLALQSNDESIPYKILLRFDGVSNFSVDSIGGGLDQIMGLDYEDVSSQGHDGINYKIFDYEENVIEFFCGSIALLSVDKIQMEI